MNNPATVTPIEKHTPEVAGRAGELVEMAGRCVIESDKDLENASDLVKFIKALVKKADDERLSITKPIKDSIKLLESKFKTVTDPLDKAETDVKRKMLAYTQEKQRKAAEEAARVAEAQRLAELEAAERTIFDDAPDLAGEAPIEASAPVPTTVRGNYGSTSSIVKRWTYKVENLAILANARPDLVQEISAAVNAEIRKGEREIPGLKIFQEDSISVR